MYYINYMLLITWFWKGFPNFPPFLLTYLHVWLSTRLLEARYSFNTISLATVESSFNGPFNHSDDFEVEWEIGISHELLREGILYHTEVTYSAPCRHLNQCWLNVILTIINVIYNETGRSVKQFPHAMFVRWIKHDYPCKIYLHINPHLM